MSTSPISASPGRSALVRTAIIYTPLFLAALVFVLGTLVGAIDGGVVLLIMAGILCLLFGYQSIQALRDLRRGTTVVTRGPVNRIWSKMDMFVSRSYYITVQRNIFRIPIQSYWDLREEAKRMRAEGTDEDYRIEVQVEHYPHTGNVVAVERLGVISSTPTEATAGQA